MPTNLDANKKKRLLVALGIFVLPVIAIAFAVFGLMHSHKKPQAKTATGSRFNTELPTPNIPSKEKTKLETYLQADQDSLKRQEDRLKDPFSQAALSANSDSPLQSGKTNLTVPPVALQPRQGVVSSPFADENDRKVTDRLEKIYAALGNGSSGPDRKPQPSFPSSMATEPSPEVIRLERLMQSFQKTDTETSPQLKQVKQVLDEIKEIQQPRPAGSSVGRSSDVARILPVTSTPIDKTEPDASMVGNISNNGFYGLDDGPSDSTVSQSGSIEAVIHGDQVVQSGSIVKLRLLQPIWVGSVQIPANAFIYGPATISGERVSIDLTSAIYDDRIFPIAMKVFDGSDGLEGLYVPGLISRDVVKQNMSQGVGGLSVGTLDPSLGAQAAAATVETMRNLLSRKIAIIKATLKAGHVVILRPSAATHS